MTPKRAPLSSAYRNSAAVRPWMLCATVLIAWGPARAGGALPTNGQSVAGQVGTSESVPMQASTYAGFDFTNVWTIAPDDIPTPLHAP